MGLQGFVDTGVGEVEEDGFTVRDKVLATLRTVLMANGRMRISGLFWSSLANEKSRVSALT